MLDVLFRTLNIFVPPKTKQVIVLCYGRLKSDFTKENFSLSGYYPRNESEFLSRLKPSQQIL